MTLKTPKPPPPPAHEVQPGRIPLHLVQGYPVVAALPYQFADRVAVVCWRKDADPHPWVCWDAYRIPEGREHAGTWAAERGDYCDELAEAIAVAMHRTGWRPESCV